MQVPYSVTRAMDISCYLRCLVCGVGRQGKLKQALGGGVETPRVHPAAGPPHDSCQSHMLLLVLLI